MTVSLFFPIFFVLEEIEEERTPSYFNNRVENRLQGRDQEDYRRLKEFFETDDAAFRNRMDARNYRKSRFEQYEDPRYERYPSFDDGQEFENNY